MANIKLIKHDGEVLILPAGSISAIGCTVGLEVKNAREAVSMVYSDFRNGTTWHLSEPVEAVLAKIKKALPAGLTPDDPWMVIPAFQPGEVFAIKQSILLSYEGQSQGGAHAGEEIEGSDELHPGDPCTIVYIRRPGPGGEGSFYADASAETIETLDAALFPKVGKAHNPRTKSKRK